MGANKNHSFSVFITVLATITAVFFVDAYAQKRTRPKKEVLCQFGPNTTIADPIISKKDQCSGSVKIQAVVRSCQPLGEVNPFTARMFKELSDSAKEACDLHCEKRHEQCIGLYKRPVRCARSIRKDSAASMGKRIGCHDGCAGKAVAYCSLYKSAIKYTGARPSIPGEAPNCFCRKKRE